MKYYPNILAVVILLGISVPAFAQDVLDNDGLIVQTNNMDDRISLNNPQVELEQISSLFLTSGERNLITEAREGFITRPPTDSEFNREQRDTEIVDRPLSPREVSLGGLLYTSSNDWTIWLNSQKITPKNIPPAIIDITVTRDYIKMKWLDAQTNQIFPVKLRAHQRFNLDTRIFLPG